MPHDHKAVVFDLDGLMFNTEELYQHVGGELLGRRDKEWTQELLNAMMGATGAQGAGDYDRLARS